MRYKDTNMSQWPHGLECHLGTRQQLEPGRQTQEELSFNHELVFASILPQKMIISGYIKYLSLYRMIPYDNLLISSYDTQFMWDILTFDLVS